MCSSDLAVTISAPSISQCGSTLTGTATASGTSTGIAGATVTLLGSSGNPILGSNGQPITTTTAADGTYSFGYLLPGTYKVKFDNITGGATTSTATVTGGGTVSVSPSPALDCSTGTISTVEDPAGDGLLRQVVGIPVLTRTSPANLITNGDFTTRPTTSSGGTTTGGVILIPGSVGDKIPGWTSSGGGASTYAKWTNGAYALAPDGASNENYYFGNQSQWSTSPTFDPTTTFNANGVTQTPHTFTPRFSGYGNNTSPVTLSQTIATTAGRTYRFQFWQASEPWGTIPGIAAFAISGYSRTYFKVNNANTAGLPNSWRRYTFEFTATQANTTISIMSWGHVQGPAGADADELRIDDVIVNLCASGDNGVTSNTTTLAVGTNGVVNATYIVPLAAVADTSSGAKGAVQTTDLTTNDTAATGNTLTKSSVYLCDAGQSDAACKTAAARTKVVTGVGSYSVNATTGVMTFTPEPNYTGTPTPLKYVISDSGNSTTSSTYTPTVIPPPTASADTSSGAFGATQTKDLLLNDVAASGQTLTASSVRLCGTGETAPNCTQTSVTRPEGTYTLTNGTVTFVPAAGYSGTPSSPVQYSVTDSLGQKSSSTYTPTVVPPPTSTSDSSIGEQGKKQVLSPLGNDEVGGPASKFVPGTLRLCATGTTSPCSLTSLSVPGEGSYTVHPDGTVEFVPEPSFKGRATPAVYDVADSFGQRTTSTLNPMVEPPPYPSANPDAKSARVGTPIVFEPWRNDQPGTKPAGLSYPAPQLVPSSIRLCGSGQSVPLCTATTLTTPDGTYTVDVVTGKVTFTGAAGFTGTATQPVMYQIANDWTGLAGPGATSSVLIPTLDDQTSSDQPLAPLPTTGWRAVFDVVMSIGLFVMVAGICVWRLSRTRILWT